MLRLAVLTARGRTGAFTGALIALFAAAVLAMAWGMQLESILRTHPPVERYAAAAAVVTGQQSTGHNDKVLLTERARVPAALVPRLAAVVHLDQRRQVVLLLGRVDVGVEMVVEHPEEPVEPDVDAGRLNQRGIERIEQQTARFDLVD